MSDKFHKQMEEAKEITIKMTKSDDGIFYPKYVYLYLDEKPAEFIAGVWLDAHIEEGVRMTITYLATDKDGKPERDPEHESGFLYRHWSQELSKKVEEVEELEENPCGGCPEEVEKE